MEHSLLVSLRKYRPREGDNPLENFITEAFAWLLKNYDSFSEYFIDKILNLLGVEIDADAFDWSTQVNFGGVFPDMLCRIGDTALVFENKAWSHLHENQLDNYRLYASQNFNDSYLILITAAASQHSQNPDLALCWSDVYVWIQEWIDSQDDEPDFIFKDFLLLIKNEGMGSPAPISNEAILSYYPSRGFKQQISDLIKK